MKKRECNNQQVCLSYDKSENSFALSGDQDEIQRILLDLNKISQGSGKAAPPIQVRSEQKIRSSNIAPPIPSPPPLHPMMAKSTLHFPLAVPQTQ